MKKLILAMGMAGVLVAAAQAVELTPSAIVAIRKAGYDLQAGNMDAMKRAVDGKVADVKVFKDGAEAIAAWAKVIPSLFPAGTEKDTKALPAVWSDRPGFEKAAATLASAAEDLSKAAAANDPAAFASAFKATGGACGGCHRTYRQK